MRLQRSFAVCLVVPFLAGAGWISLTWFATGEGRPVCLNSFAVPSSTEITHRAIRQHIVFSEVLRAGGGAILEDDIRAVENSSVEAFVASNPECCKVIARGSTQHWSDKVLNVALNHEKVEVRVKDSDLDEPYQTFGRDYTVEACSAIELSSPFNLYQ